MGTTHKYYDRRVVTLSFDGIWLVMKLYDMLEQRTEGDPIWVNTLSNHCRGPFRWSSIQQGVLVTVCLLFKRIQENNYEMKRTWLSLATWNKNLDKRLYILKPNFFWTCIKSKYLINDFENCLILSLTKYYQWLLKRYIKNIFCPSKKLFTTPNGTPVWKNAVTVNNTPENRTSNQTRAVLN